MLILLFTAKQCLLKFSRPGIMVRKWALRMRLIFPASLKSHISPGKILGFSPAAVFRWRLFIMAVKFIQFLGRRFCCRPARRFQLVFSRNSWRRSSADCTPHSFDSPFSDCHSYTKYSPSGGIVKYLSSDSKYLYP
jgi:hypothetical protein